MKSVLLAMVLMLVGVVIHTHSATTSSTGKPTTTEKPPVNCNVEPDSSEEAILLPNPKNCSSYYACVGLKPVLMPCPDGLHFNPELKVCDWPELANCTLSI